MIIPKQAIPVLDDMGFSSYQVIDKEHIHIFERLGESASLNMELAKAGFQLREYLLQVKSLRIIS